jgi:hypothetical protein
MNEIKPSTLFSYAIKTNLIRYQLILRQRYIILINSSQSTEDMLEVVNKNNAKCEKGDKQTKQLIWKQKTESSDLALKLTCNVDHQKMVCVVSYCLLLQPSRYYFHTIWILTWKFQFLVVIIHVTSCFDISIYLSLDIFRW